MLSKPERCGASEGAPKHPEKVSFTKPLQGVLPKNVSLTISPCRNVCDRVSRELPEAAWVSNLDGDTSTCAHSARRNSRGAQHDKPHCRRVRRSKAVLKSVMLSKPERRGASKGASKHPEKTSF